MHSTSRSDYFIIVICMRGVRFIAYAYVQAGTARRVRDRGGGSRKRGVVVGGGRESFVWDSQLAKRLSMSTARIARAERLRAEQLTSFCIGSDQVAVNERETERERGRKRVRAAFSVGCKGRPPRADSEPPLLPPPPPQDPFNSHPASFNDPHGQPVALGPLGHARRSSAE